MIVVEYVPLGFVLSTFAENQNVVTSDVAAALVARTAVDDVGIAANFEVFVVWFELALYDASKPLPPGVNPVVPLATAYPHVLFASAIGDAHVPLVEAIVFAPFTSVALLV